MSSDTDPPADRGASPLRQRRRHMPVEQRREQLLRAATDVFLELGYDKTRISDIVARANVAQGTFYLHFASKADAYLAIPA